MRITKFLSISSELYLSFEINLIIKDVWKFWKGMGTIYNPYNGTYLPRHLYLRNHTNKGKTQIYHKFFHCANNTCSCRYHVRSVPLHSSGLPSSKQLYKSAIKLYCNLDIFKLCINLVVRFKNKKWSLRNKRTISRRN